MAKQDEIVRRTKHKQRAMEKAKERVDEYQLEIKQLGNAAPSVPQLTLKRFLLGKQGIVETLT
jgi:hypothetical protein